MGLIEPRLNKIDRLCDELADALEEPYNFNTVKVTIDWSVEELDIQGVGVPHAPTTP